MSDHPVIIHRAPVLPLQASHGICAELAELDRMTLGEAWH